LIDMAPRSKRWILLVGCVVATLAMLEQARPTAAPEGRVSRRAGSPPEALTSTGRPIVLAGRNQLPPMRSNPFAARAEPSPPPAAPTPQADSAPPGPQVPPVPYRWAGKVTYGGKSRVALTAGDRIHLVVEGDTVDGGYVVQKIGPETVTLVYTPLGVSHELAYVQTEASPPTAPVQIASEVTAPSANQAAALSPR
jgi:hypothetical protein